MPQRATKRAASPSGTTNASALARSQMIDALLRFLGRAASRCKKYKGVQMTTLLLYLEILLVFLTPVAMVAAFSYIANRFFGRDLH
jgi:membrane glycosyltransferase